MDKYDVDDFARNVVVALAHSGKIDDSVQAVDQYDAFIKTMDARGNIDPEEDDDDDDE